MAALFHDFCHIVKLDRLFCPTCVSKSSLTLSSSCIIGPGGWDLFPQTVNPAGPTLTGLSTGGRRGKHLLGGKKKKEVCGTLGQVLNTAPSPIFISQDQQ